MKQTVRQSVIYIFAAAMAALCLFLTFSASYLNACATTGELTWGLDNSSVENDLEEMDLSAYSAEDGVQIVYFAEIGFSRTDSSDYGLYVYVYNPDGIAIDTSLNNVLNMAVSFDSSGEASGYRNMGLTYIDHTDDYLYYKFKVTSAATMYSVALSYADSWNCRRYEIAGLQLWESGASQARDYEIALAYIYSGYAKGCSAQSEDASTLECTVEESRVITFSDVQQTYYRYPQTSNTYAELKTVYFSIPNEILDFYGEIYSIQAEYYEYDLQPIVIAEDIDVYSDLSDYVGVSVSSLDRTPYVIDAIESVSVTISDTYYYYNWRYAKGILIGFLTDTHVAASDVIEAEKLVYLFHADDADGYTVSREELVSYMDAYTATNGRGAAYGGYNDDLFFSTSAGYSGATYIDIAADELFTISGFDSGSVLENWFAALFGDYDFSDLADIEPIHVVTQRDLNSSDISGNLYVAAEDVSDFTAFCRQEMAAGNTVYMFRYKVDDYVDEDAHFMHNEDWIVAGWTETYGSVRFATIDLGFDIISIGFAGEYGLTIIAAVSDPINVIPDIQSGITIVEEVLDDNDVSWLTIATLIFAGLCGLLITRIIKKYAKNNN